MCLCFYSSFTENLRTAEEKQNNLEFLQLLKLGGIKYAKPLKKADLACFIKKKQKKNR